MIPFPEGGHEPTTRSEPTVREIVCMRVSLGLLWPFSMEGNLTSCQPIPENEVVPVRDNTSGQNERKDDGDEPIKC
jgi:hypothetical protein